MQMALKTKIIEIKLRKNKHCTDRENVLPCLHHHTLTTRRKREIQMENQRMKTKIVFASSSPNKPPPKNMPSLNQTVDPLSVYEELAKSTIEKDTYKRGVLEIYSFFRKNKKIVREHLT